MHDVRAVATVKTARALSRRLRSRGMVRHPMSTGRMTEVFEEKHLTGISRDSRRRVHIYYQSWIPSWVVIVYKWAPYEYLRTFLANARHDINFRNRLIALAIADVTPQVAAEILSC